MLILWIFVALLVGVGLGLALEHWGKGGTNE